MNKLYIFCLIILIPVQVAAKDLSRLYEQSTLEYWGTRYRPNLQYNFTDVILPVLNKEDRRKLADVQLRFPLVGRIGGDPLEFYSYREEGRPIVDMPVLSIKFFDDIAVAYAWLQLKGYSIETVTDYITMLKYGKPDNFPGSHYPTPFKSLHIPDNALRDSDVDGLSQKILKSALVWILSHELAHIYYNHPGYGPNVSALQAQRNEEEADRFATEIMRRIGVAPLGMANFLTVAVHWWQNRGDFTSEKGWQYHLDNATHPLTATRIRKMAARITEGARDFARKEPDYASALRNVTFAAGEMAKLARLLEDKDLQQFIRARAGRLIENRTSLVPRRP